MPNKNEFEFWCLMPLSAIFQLYDGDQFQWRRKPEYQQRTTYPGQVTGKLPIKMYYSHNVIQNNSNFCYIFRECERCMWSFDRHHNNKTQSNDWSRKGCEKGLRNSSVRVVQTHGSFKNNNRQAERCHRIGQIATRRELVHKQTRQKTCLFL